VKAPTHQRFSELQLALESSRGDLVRAFIREASLADGVAASVASLIADDTAHFERIGPNVAIELSQALRDVQGLGANSMQLSGPLGDPGLLLLTDAARSLGFFFCGLGPAFADGEDIFLLQLLSEPLDTEKLQLFTDMAKELVAFIDRDRSAAAGRSLARSV
jgi:hypothetical protein